MRRMKRKPPKMTVRFKPETWRFVSAVIDKTGWAANTVAEKLVNVAGVVIDNNPEVCKQFVDEMQTQINLHATEVRRNQDVAKARTAAFLARRAAEKQAAKLPAASASVEKAKPMPALVKSLGLSRPVEKK